MYGLKRAISAQGQVPGVLVALVCRMQAGKAGALGQQVGQELQPRLAKAKGKTRDCHGNDLNSGPSDATYWLVTTGPSPDCEMG